MSGFVIDASIAVKWVIEEPGTGLALALRHRPLIAPELLAAECANILWKKAHRSDVELRPMRPLMAAATALAIALGHPACDCVYLALAAAADLPFVTADTRLLSRIARDDASRFTGRVLGLPAVAASLTREAE